MYLSADIIFEELKKIFDVRLEGTSDAGLFLKSVYFYREEQEVKINSVYIADRDALPGSPAGLMVYMEEGICPGIHLVCKEDIFKVFNVIQDIFDKYNSWDEELSRLLQDQAGIGRMLLISAPVIGNPLAAVNSHLELVGAVDYDEALDEKWYLRDIGDVPVEYAGRMRIMESEANRSQESFLYHDVGARPVWGVNLFAHGEYSGSLSMIEKRAQFTEGHFELLKHLKKYIEEEVFHRDYARHAYITPIKTALGSLLSGERGNEQQIEENIRDFFGMENVPDSWLEIVIHPDPGVKLAVPEYLISAVDDLVLNGITFLYEENVVCLISNPEEKYVKAALDRMLEPMRKINMSIGVSNLFFSLEEFCIGYRQAVCAIETGRSMGRQDEIFSFPEYLLHYILRNAKGMFEARDIMTPGIKRLIRHDSQKNVSYIETLRCYLEHDRNISAAAKALYLHRSSLEQRLERIYAMLDSRLEEADERLYYCLILRMMKEEEQYIL